MFYDKSLMNSKLIGKVWKMAHNIECDKCDNSDEDTSLPRICNKLDLWIGDDGTHKNLSLRTSSHLIGGTAKFYKTGVNKLFEDLQKLDENMVHRKRRLPHCTSPEADNDSHSASPESPEQMRRQAIPQDIDHHSDIELGSQPISDTTSVRSPILPVKRSRKVHTPSSSARNMATSFHEDGGASSTPKELYKDSPKKKSRNIPTPTSTITPSPVKRRPPGNRSMRSSTNSEIGRNISRNTGESQTKVKEIRKLDKATQTDPDNSGQSQDFDPNIAFGCTFIYDNYRTKIPSLLILSSVNKDVMKLI